jgi:hypothetical protein
MALADSLIQVLRAALLERPDVDEGTRRRIETEVRRIRAGAAGERDAAYEIEFHSGAHPGRATLHDLRLEVDGRIAQIDHLYINRLMDAWVLESKHFAEGVAINDHGEWTGFFGGRPYGMASPIEQNRRHVAVLEQVFATGLVQLPKRLGLTIRPRIRPLRRTRGSDALPAVGQRRLDGARCPGRSRG